MSTINYVLVADTSDAYEIGENFLSDKFVWHDMSLLSLDAISIDLECMLEEAPLKEVLEPDDIPPILYDGGTESHWVHLVPERCVKLMANMSDEQVPKLSKRLIKENQFLAESFDENNLPAFEDHLQKLRELCKQSIESDKSVLLYIGV
ncbi:MAG TPA: hypothetical protein V6C81_08800 [Planktothrix sp.]